jgi:hypothetical protein
MLVFLVDLLGVHGRDVLGPLIGHLRLRRAAVTKIWDRGVARGELDPNVDPEVALDLIFGAALYRDGNRARRINPGRRRRHRGHSDAGTGQLIGWSGPGLTLSPTLLLTTQVIESMTTRQPVVRVLVVLPVPLDVGLVGGGGPKA